MVVDMNSINSDADDGEEGHRLYPDERRVLATRLKSLNDSNYRISHTNAMAELAEFKANLKD